MRMRKKKNLDERLNAASERIIMMANDSLDYRDAEAENRIIDLAALFGNQNPVYLEIGSGKGRFACTFAAENPDKNILCVERNRNVLVPAAEASISQGLENIRFICGTAEYLPSYIAKDSIECVFLNFSCPFPKHRHIAHRLTNPRFLKIYKSILKPNGAICQKTDNMHFFEYSIEQFSKCGFILENISLDLHNSGFEGNIETEYEMKFASQGMPIYRLEARCNKQRT